MKKTLKCALLAAAALTAAASAQAQSTAYNGDLVLGLTAGSGNDLL